MTADPQAEAPEFHAPGVTVDPWDPAYAAPVGADALAELEASSAELHLDAEVPAGQWTPLDPDADAPTPEALLVVDGVRRIDARIWVDDPDGGVPAPGIAASYAAGVARCGPVDGDGAPAALAETRVRRTAVTAAPHCPPLRTSQGDYPARLAAGHHPEKLSGALQEQLAELENAVAENYRRETGLARDLLILDGPLRGRTHLPRAVGYIKTHHAAYLPTEQAKVVTGLEAGQRSPIFLMGTSWSRYAWYVRLPTRSAAPWAGVVRCEGSPDHTPAEACRLAGLTAAVLPALAGVEHKDPRAPQNLVPIGGLEKLLRHRLGDPRLLYRALRSAAQP